MQLPSLILAGLLALGLGSPGALADEARLDPACLDRDRQSVELGEVVDGDTVRLSDGRVVRLAGVEAPKRPPGAADPSPLENRAREALGQLLSDRPLTFVSEDPGGDRYGRIHGDLFIAGGTGAMWAQARMIDLGLSRVIRPTGDKPCAGYLYALERAAIAKERGMWADPFYRVKAADDPSLTDQKGLYEIVEGRVLSIGGRSYMTFVDFGTDYRHDFTIMVTPSMVERLAEAGRPVDELENRWVRVRGVIELSGGPAIRLKRVDDLELLIK